MALVPGLRAVTDAVVTAADTASAQGSGDLPVLGTPRVLAYAEAATVRAVAAELPSGTTSVGTRVELDHLAPSRIGAVLRAEAVLEAVEGRRLRFGVEVREGDVVLARGVIWRAIVERSRFGAG